MAQANSWSLEELHLDVCVADESDKPSFLLMSMVYICIIKIRVENLLFTQQTISGILMMVVTAFKLIASMGWSLILKLKDSY